MQAMEPISGTIRTFEGQAIRVRPIESGDWRGLQRFHIALSDETIEQRMFESMPELSDERAHDYCDVDGYDRFALVAIDPDRPNELIGVVRFDREPEDNVAEYSAVVTDRWQGQGVGLALSVLLISAARERCIDVLHAYVRPENWRMLALLRNLGLPETIVHERGEERVSIEIEPIRDICIKHPPG